DDGVRLDVLGNAEGEAQVSYFGFSRCALGDDLEVEIVDDGVVARLDQHAAGNGLRDKTGRARVWKTIGDEQAQVLLGGDDLDRFRRSVRRDDDFGEGLDDLFGSFRVKQAVERDDPAEGRRRIAGERREIRFLQ